MRIKLFQKVKGWIQLQLSHIDEALPSTLQLTLIIPLSCISRLVLWSIPQLRMMTSGSSLSAREDTTAPIHTPAVRVRGGWFVTTTVCLYASLLQVHVAAVKAPNTQKKSTSTSLKEKEGITDQKSSSTTYVRSCSALIAVMFIYFRLGPWLTWWIIHNTERWIFFFLKKLVDLNRSYRGDWKWTVGVD